MFCGTGAIEVSRIRPFQRRGEASMSTDAPAWGDWTTHYDPVGQASTMTRFDDESGLIVSFGMDRLELDLGSGQDAPFAGAVGLSGALAVRIPDEFPLLGFLLIVNGQITKTPGVEATVTCSLGPTSRSIEWLVDRPGGLPDPPPSDAVGNQAVADDELFDRGFSMQGLMLDNRPGAVGAAPFPPVPPVPITVSLQARRRFMDEFAHLTIGGFDVLIVRS
jgi:hypothetical protein